MFVLFNRANNITSRYPEYEVSFHGIGPGPPGTEELGCCSQMAVFTRTHELHCHTAYGIEGLLNSVTVQEFPHRIDNRSDEEKILDEAAYYIRQFGINNAECLEEYPLSNLLRHLEKFYITVSTLREILENGGYSVIDLPEGPAVTCPAISSFSDYDDEIDADEGEWPDYEWQPTADRDDVVTWATDNVEAVYNDSWDDNFEIPTIDHQDNVESSDVSSDLEVKLSGTRRIDETNLDEFGLPCTSPARLASQSGSFQPERPAPFLETVEPQLDLSVNQNENSLLESRSQSHSASSNFELNNAAAFDLSASSMKSSKSPEPLRCALSGEKLAFGHGDTTELGSLCSMYLEASRNEEMDECPQNITNPSFDCGTLEVTFEKSRKSTTPDPQLRERLSSPSTGTSTQPQFASSPIIPAELREQPRKASIATKIFHSDNLKSVSQISLQSNGNSCSTTTSSCSSFATVKKLYPPECNSMYSSDCAAKLKGGNEHADDPTDEQTSESGEISPSDSFIDVERRNLHVTRLQRQKAPESLDLRSTTNSREANVSTSNFLAQSSCSRNSLRTRDGASSDHFSSYLDLIVKTIDDGLAVTAHRSASLSGSSRLAEASEMSEAKPASPETPPNSWSPEIMDSGYPNSSSTQDMTPEYDLSSIAQDRISDSESPSVAEAPRLGFLEHADVENGDLANNNRDDEGNNMIAEAEDDLVEDLQPLIDVLEDDMENENDIYALENDFPMWLLRILERGNAVGRQAVADLRVQQNAFEADIHAAGDAGLPDHDEGFDSTSSENDDSDADDDNAEELSTESSEETIDWNASGDYC